MLEKTLKSPLDCKEIKPVNPKGNQSWIFIRRTDAEAEAPTLWPLDAKNWLTGKDPDAGGRRRRGQWRMRRLDGITNLMDIEFEQVPGVGDGQGSLACCSPWGLKELDTTEQLHSLCCLGPYGLCCCCCSVTMSCQNLWDPMDCNTPGFPVLHYFPEFAKIHIH